MNIHPQLQPFLAGAAAFPRASAIPVTALRQAVHQASAALPPPALPIGKIEDRTIPGPGGDLALRLYWPVGASPAPIIVYYHGGGFILGDLDTQDMICRGLCHHAEAIVLSVDYRLAPEHPFPAAPDDCFAATQWAAAHAAQIGGIPGRLAIAGDSAGATLAAGVALRARDNGGPALCAQLLAYGSFSYPTVERPSMIEFRDAPILNAEELLYYWRQYLADPDAQRSDPLASPALASSHAGLPPTFVLTGETDPIRDDSENYGLTLIAAGVPVTMRRYLGMVHGFLSWAGLVGEAQKATRDAGLWLKQQFSAVEQ